MNQKKIENSKWIERAARIGYAARGIVYLIVGGLAFLAAYGSGEAVGSKGALSTLKSQNFGATLITTMIVGLAGYSIWRLIQALFDADKHGTDLKALGIRGGLFISAITHASLAFWAYSSLIQGQSSDSSSSTTSKILELSYGPYLILLISLGVFCAALAQIWKAYKEKFMDHFKSLPSQKLVTLCKIGLIAKGLAFMVISYLFFQTFLTGQNEGSKGIGVALNVIQQQNYGWLALGVMGLGLVAFAGYSILEAVYRKV